jgi:hypothetical protein
MILRRYKPPKFPKIDPPPRDPSYLAWIRRQPCAVCRIWKCPGRVVFGNIEAAHVGLRGLGQKCSDRQVIPLCVNHHRMGIYAVHVLGRSFWTFWKLSRVELIEEYNQQYEKERKHDTKPAA